jgi:amino acid transporter
MVFTFPIIALKAGPDMPLSLLLATTICFFIGNTVVQFSKYMPSSGSYYSFTTRGLGNRVGYMAAWSYLTYDILGAAGSIGFLGYLLADMLRTALHINVAWWLIALVTFAGVWALTHYGIQLSARVTAILGGLQIFRAAGSLAFATPFRWGVGGHGFFDTRAQRV